MGFAHVQESFLHCMLDKPDSSRIHVGHNHGALYLNELGCVMEVDNNEARDTFEKKFELEKDSLHNSSLVLAGSLDRAGQVDS